MEYQTNQGFEEIDRYLAGDLPPDENAIFEQKLANDERLQQTLEMHKLANMIVVEAELEKVASQLKQYEFKTKPNLYKKWLWRLVMCFIGLICVCFFVNTKTDNDQETPPSKNEIEKEELLPVKKVKLSLSTQKEQKYEPVSNSSTIKKEESSRKINHEIIDTNHVEKNETIASDEHQTIENGKDITLEKKEQQQKNNSTLLKPIKISTTIKKACDDDSELGEIIPRVTGGEPPYSYFLDGEYVTDLAQLYAGAYTLQVLDAQNKWSDKEEVIITTKNCKTVESDLIDDAFSPSMEQQWTSPIHENLEGELMILDKNYRQVFTVTIPNGQYYEWDGTNQSGGILPIGVYVIKIVYTDGTTKYGTVEII